MWSRQDNQRDRSRRAGLLAVFAVVICVGMTAGAARAEPLKVTATIPDLGSIAEAVGGDAVEVTVFTRGREDPHFLEPRPSFIRVLADADLYIQVGLELEAGWAPLVLRNARNARVQPGGRGYIDASAAIEPKGVPTGPVDRSMGHIHVLGNPHYMLDPLNGLRVAGLIRDRLIELRPGERGTFESGYERFRQRVAEGLIGAELAELYDVERLMLLADHGQLEAFLEEQGQLEMLGGWLGQMRPFAGAEVVGDHHMWLYLADRFGLEMVGHMEPKPGLPPTTRHLGGLVQMMRERGVDVIVNGPYFDRRHAEFLARNTDVRVVMFAHQVGGVEGADDYVSLFDENIRRLAEGLGE